MPTLTAAEEAVLDSQRLSAAKVNWYLALAPYGDPTFTALINDGGAGYGDRDIVYDNDVGENTIVPGMTLWVGTAANSFDVGKVRIRSINTGTNTITVAENDHIEWDDDLYLTCPGADGFHELWGVYARITEAGDVVTFYEDYDLVFNAAQDDVLPPKANGGPPVCAFLGNDGYVDIDFMDNGESYTTEVGAAILTYLWDFADGVVQSGSTGAAGTCAVPNVIRFNTTGFRYVTLMVTDNTVRNRTAIMYIPVWIFDSDEMPIGIEMVSQDGTPNWSTRFKVFDTDVAEVYDFPDGARCVIFTISEYPDGTDDIGGFCHRSNIHFDGWLDKESLSWSIDGGTVEYTAIDHCKRLNQLPGFAYTVEDEATPTDWYMVADLNFDRATLLHLQRRSTACSILHIEQLGEGATRPIAIQPYPDASVYVQVQDHLMVDAMASLLADRQGILRVRRDPQFMDPADRNTVDVVTTLEITDILNVLDESRVHQPELGYVRLGGWNYETPLLSEAPGVAPDQSEGAVHQEGFIVTGQAELNLWAACWYCKANAPYKQIPVEMNGYWPVFDPAFQEYVRITVTDPMGHNPLSNVRFIVRGVEFKSLPADGTEVTHLVVEMESPLCAANLVNIIDPPTPPGPPPPPSPPEITMPIPDIAVVNDRENVYSTLDFTALNPVWNNITGALNGLIHAVECDHFDGVGAWAITGTNTIDDQDTANNIGLWRTDDVTVGAPVWTLVFTGLQASNNRPFRPTGGCTGGIGAPNFGQMRSINPIGPGECLVSEARYQGLTFGLGDSTGFWKVDSVGGFELWNEFVKGAPNAGFTDGWPNFGWILRCGSCSDTAPSNPNTSFIWQGMYVNGDEHRGSHQVALGPGATSITPAGIWRMRENTVRYGGWCNTPTVCCAPPGCNILNPWPNHRDVGCAEHLLGSLHVIYAGRWGQSWPSIWAQSQKALGGSWGALYSSMGEVDDDLWSNYALCNICSNQGRVYYCKQIGGRINELYYAVGMNTTATGVTSDLLFGGGSVLPVYDAGVIGHIRSIRDDVGTIVLVRKNQHDALQPNNDVVWTWDPTNGLQNKTGNLNGIVWHGTGRSLPPVLWGHQWDNVGFSAFGVPIR